MKEGQQCTNCNNPQAMHSIHEWWKTPKDQYLCCKCYVQQGGAPLDSHPICVQTYKLINPDVYASFINKIHLK